VMDGSSSTIRTEAFRSSPAAVMPRLLYEIALGWALMQLPTTITAR
jgi:hypothetical protein